MKKILIYLLLSLVIVCHIQAQSDLSVRKLLIKGRNSGIDARGGVPMWWDGFIYGQYSGDTRDCIYFDYTGTGKYVLNLEKDGSGIFTIDENGDIISVGSLGLTALTVEDDAVSTPVIIGAYHNTEATTPLLTLRKADGTIASPATIDSGAVLGTINFQGYDNDGFDTGARIYGKADANWGASERGTDIFFSNRDGAGALTDRVVIEADGNVGIGETDPTAMLHVSDTSVVLLKLIGSSSKTRFSVAATGGASFDANVTFTANKSISSFNNLITLRNSGTDDLYLAAGDGQIHLDDEVGIGTGSPDTQLEVSEDAADTVITISSYHDTEATTPTLTMRKADNTEASPAAVDANAVLGTINFDGYDNDGWDTGAVIYSKADANWGASERGTEMYFGTRDGAGALTDQFKITADGHLRAETSEWYTEQHFEVINLSPGGSGPDQVVPTSNTLGGYNLDADGEYLYFTGHIHSDWDAASDINIQIAFECDVDNTGGSVGDDAEFDLLCYYKNAGQTSNKTQTPTVAVDVDQSARYKLFESNIVIDYDLASNVVELDDVIAIRINFDASNSDIADVVLTHITLRYQTAQVKSEI